MNGQTVRGNKGSYTIARILGKGGEGQVYDLQNNNALVLKLYNDMLDVEKERKLLYMTAMNASEIQAFAAWPTDVIIDNNRKVIGFVMRKLTGYVPLHMLFSPMDRKKIFPDKGYNFLIHVARNLASAFHKLNQAGIIVGDVNEGNILVNASGMVAFIDCDSFQIKEGNKYYFCEVGVPRYTAPELLVKGSFENIVRTGNTDSFSMSILIFQLLFLGRHPFAGKNLSKEDIDEDTAIRNCQFAYSLRNAEKKLRPPDDSFEIKNLSEGLIQLFHQSFEAKDIRPSPDKWIQELDVFSKGIVACPVSKIHSYPKRMAECPWCYFNKTKGIVYFIDDTYFKINPIANIESFVNGFKIDPLSFAKMPVTYNDNDQQPDAIDIRYTNIKSYKQAAFVFTVLLFVALCFINLWFIAAGLVALASLDSILPYGKKIKEELSRRNTEFTTLKSQFDALIREFNNPPELITHNKAVTQFNSLIGNFKNLPGEFSNRKRSIEEILYNEQLHSFLKGFDISSHNIPSFGIAKKSMLYKNGFQTAADITKLNSIKIYGIGPRNIQILLSWQRQFSSKFVYKPDNNRLSTEINKISADISAKKNQLESVIRRDYSSLQYSQGNILNKQGFLESRIKSLAQKVYKAELNYLEFKKLVA